jgi:hypothetical protein
MKSCTKCKILKETLDFYKNIRHHDGLQHICKNCTKLYNKIYREKNPLCSKVCSKRWRFENKDHVAAYSKNYDQRNIESRIERSRSWKRKNAEYVSATKRQWRLKNPALVKANKAKRRAIKKQAMPSWISKESFVTIYKNCPENMQVDHIIPLKHKDVCGLHVPWNMQYLSKFDNFRKNNRFDGTYLNEGWR